MKFFSVVLVAMMFIVGCGDRTSKEAASGATSANTPPPAGGDTAGQGGSTKGHGMGSATAGGMMMSGDMENDMSKMNEMMVTNLGQKDASYDQRFIDMMIPHHEGAIMMAKDAVEHANKPELLKMANDVIASQQKEIDQMKAWRAKWYGDWKPSGMADGGGMMKHMSMMNDMMVNNLGQKDHDYEDRFIDTMITHHQGAIKMADDALAKADHPEIKRMAQAIIDAQKKEIAQMEQWRKTWYGH